MVNGIGCTGDEMKWNNALLPDNADLPVMTYQLVYYNNIPTNNTILKSLIVRFDSIYILGLVLNDEAIIGTPIRNACSGMVMHCHGKGFMIHALKSIIAGL